MTYKRSDPLDPPMVEIHEDGAWHPGHVEAQEQLADGTWEVHVVYRRDGGNHRGTFKAQDVRPDETDYSRGRGVGGGS